MTRFNDAREGLHVIRYAGFSVKRCGWIAALAGALAQAASGQDTLSTWLYTTPITLNAGGKTTTTQKNFPVLIRLTSLNAAAVFATAQTNGGDLRFSHAGDTGQIPYELNKYDPVRQRAYIWVRADSVPATGSQTIRMWWGKSTATTTSNPANVFQTANGFDLVWHLNGNTGGSGAAASPYTFTDATGQGRTGLGYGTVDSPGVVLDSCRAFDKEGTANPDDSIVVNSLLGSPASLTMSSWIKLDSIDNRPVPSRTDFFTIGDYVDFSVRTRDSTANKPDTIRVSIQDSTVANNYKSESFWPSAGMTGMQYKGQGWKHVALVIHGASSGHLTDTEWVYVNGVALNPGGASGVTGFALEPIGWSVGTTASQTGGNTKLGAKEGFANGVADTERFFGSQCEFRVDNVARPADWLKLCFENQQMLDSLTSLSAVGLGIPALSQPSNNAVGQAVNLTLSWNSSALATSYGVQVSTSANFNTTVFQQTGLSAPSAALTGLANGTIYYWSANAANANQTSSWSVAWSFLTIAAFGAPPLVTPTNSAINQSTSPTLTWGAVSGATTYWLQVSTESAFATPMYNSGDGGLISTSLSVPGLSNYTTYYWEVNANNGSTDGGWSGMWSFTTVIATPTLSTPVNGAVNQPVSLTLNWGAVPGAASYSLEVSSSATFAGAPAVNLSGITNLSQAVSGLATSTTYYWEVSATGGNGGTGIWSAAWSFQTVPPPPGVPALSTPANGASSQPLSPNLTWGTVANAASYEVQVSLSSGFSATILDQPGLAAPSEAIGPLGFATAYYWRVNAANGGGGGAWSGAYSFTTVENYATWSYHMPIGLNTSATGANVANNVNMFPVLVRLNTSNFSGFSQVNYQPGIGAIDIRFSKTDYTKAFPYQIDYWSPTNDTAVIWVLVDTVLGNSSSQSIVMHYGNGGAANASSGAAVFDTANGFAGVWHLNTGATQIDATINNRPGTADGLLIDTMGIIGHAKKFTVANNDSIMINSLMGSPSVVTMSCWAKVDSADAAGPGAELVSIGDNVVMRVKKNYTNLRDSMYVSYKTASASWNNIGAPSAGAQTLSHIWTYYTYVCNPAGSLEATYVNGQQNASTAIATVIFYSNSHTLFGKNGSGSTTYNLGGVLEEPRIDKVARSADWIKLCFQNQQANQTLLAFATLPSIPTLASPTNNATGQPTALTLSWNSVSGALTYEVRVATAAGFGVATVSDQAGLTGVSATVAGLAGSTTYYWQVNATNGAGTTAWSAAWSFTTTIGSPALSSPANGATGQPVTLSLSWGSVSGAVSYGVQVSTDMSFGSTMSGQSGLTGLYDVVSGLTGGVTYYWEVDATGAAATGAWSGAWSFSAGMTQVIPLNTAWNMKSLNVIPLQDTTTMVFGTDPGGFLFVKDNAGDVYCPAAYQDNINYVQVGQGYQVYTTVPDTMEVMGIPVNYAATAIALSSGWNTIAYLPPSDDSIEHALAGIDTLLIIVKNNSGHAYWPSLGIDDIGIMYVGEGYKVLMSSAASLTYPTPDTGVAKRVAARGGKTMLRLPEPRHYATHANTGNNATLLAKRVTIGDKVVPDSSEIGAFDGTGSLVGSGTVMHGIAAFAVWGVDPQSKTKKKDGCAVLEPVTFRLWDGKREYPLDYVTQNGTPAKYGVDKVFLGVLSVPEGYLITKFDLTRAYPNPFRGSVKIAFDVPTIGGVSQHGIELAVYDLKGSLVKQLASGLYQAGHYALSWNSGEGRESAVGSSVYIVRMKAANFDKRLKLVRIQ